MGVKESWERMAAWARADMPQAGFTALPPATDEQIAAAEAALGLPLPADLKDTYRLHNGTRDWSLPHGVDLIPVDALASWYAGQRDTFVYYEQNGYAKAEAAEGPIKPVRWTDKRIQICENGGGDGIQIDLDPAEGGTVGQVIWFDHEVGPRRVLAPSWAAYLEQIVSDCDAGVYYYDEEEEQPWSRRDEDEDDGEDEADDPAAHPDNLAGMDDAWDDMLAEAEREDGLPPGGYRPGAGPEGASGR